MRSGESGKVMRILTGQYKGRKLLSPPSGGGTRPITGLARKSLFDILSADLVGATMVDLYCGTGTMGLEGLSRGADFCCFADRDPAVLKRLQRNIESLGVEDKCVIWRGDVPDKLGGWVARLDRTVDVAFVDPPYAQSRTWNWDRVGRNIFAPLQRKLSDGGSVVLRLPSKVELPSMIGQLAVTRKKTYGGMLVLILRRRGKER